MLSRGDLCAPSDRLRRSKGCPRTTRLERNGCRTESRGVFEEQVQRQQTPFWRLANGVRRCRGCFSPLRTLPRVPSSLAINGLRFRGAFALGSLSAPDQVLPFKICFHSAIRTAASIGPVVGHSQKSGETRSSPVQPQHPRVRQAHIPRSYRANWLSFGDREDRGGC